MINRPTAGAVSCRYHPGVKEMAKVKTTRLFWRYLILVSLVFGSPVYGETLVPNWIHAGGENGPAEALTPSDVLARVKQVQGELELIRFEMGKPKTGMAHVSVTQAVPREAYFQALTLLDKADRLAFEQTGSFGDELTRTSPEAVRPEHVWKMVDTAHQRIVQVKEKLSITQAIKETSSKKEATPTDVFQAIVETNRQLNVLLEQQYAPQDVFRQVTYALHYTAKLLVHVPNAKRIPNARPFEHGKTPSDVYDRLLECFGRVETIARQSGLATLKLNRTQTKTGLIRPSDVYDIASLIVSDLAFVHSQFPGARVPNQAYDPGRKFPAHVYQRAGILLDQLRKLEQYVQTTPHWLEG